MSDKPTPDWNPRAADVQREPRQAYDRLREHCPVAYSELLQWSLFRHADITHVLHDPATFSSAVSNHLSVPNGMDPPQHTGYRRIIERYFTPVRVDAFEPGCRDIAATLVDALDKNDTTDLMQTLAQPFALHVQCAFLGWPHTLHDTLLSWSQRNHEATLAQDRPALAATAAEFEQLVDDLIEERQKCSAAPDSDVTASLMHETIDGRPLNNKEIASIVRNWTVGEIGTISAAVGILGHHLAHDPDLQQQLRHKPELLPAAIDEILRIHGPLVTNRRVTTRPVEIGGRTLAAGAKLSLNWVAANRDGRVFDDPESVRLDRDPADNLLYGAGIHVCPGMGLARMELQVVMEELLARTATLIPAGDATLAVYPASGYAALPLRIG